MLDSGSPKISGERFKFSPKLGDRGLEDLRSSSYKQYC